MREHISRPDSRSAECESTAGRVSDVETIIDAARPEQHAGVAFSVNPPGLSTGRVRRMVSGSDPLGGTAVPDGTLDILARRRGGGQPLPEHVAAPMGEQLGVNLSGVRVHADVEAQRVSRSLQATAFTHGTDIYFGAGAYDPGSMAGRRVLAHELAHVAQQVGGSATSSPPVIGRADDPAEAQADQAADAVLRRLQQIAHSDETRCAPEPLRALAGPGDRFDALRRQSAWVDRRSAIREGLEAPPAQAFPDPGNVVPAATGNVMSRGPRPSSPLGPIRRKVGFELELTLDLAKGRITTAPEKQRKKPAEQFVGFGGRGLSEERQPLMIPEEGPRLREQVEILKDAAITKGETIRSGSGWRLTPDGGDGNWYPEFITDPVDEDKQSAVPAQVMNDLEGFVNKEWGNLVRGQYTEQGNGFIVGLSSFARGRDLGANIHFTVGVRPDKLLGLMNVLATGTVPTASLGKGKAPEGSRRGQDSDSTLAIDDSTRNILRNAVSQGAQTPGDPVYQGLVALMGSYIAGELRMEQEMLHDIKRSLRSENKRLDHCVDADDLGQFIATGAVTDPASLGYVTQQYSSYNEFAEDLRQYLTGFAPAAAKLSVPVLSRSSLAELREQTTVTSLPAFLGHVLAAAGLGPQQDTGRLFPLGISNPKSSRTIEANPSITIGEWVKSVFDGKNLTFTDETKSFEKVGPVLGSCLCFFETRAKGAVIEIRALDGTQKVPPRLWGTLANEVVAMMLRLNNAD